MTIILDMSTTTSYGCHFTSCWSYEGHLYNALYSLIVVVYKVMCN